MTTRRAATATAALFAVSVAGAVSLSAHLAEGPGILARRWAILSELALGGALWAAAVAAALRLPRQRAVPLILAAGVAIRLAALAGPPTTSDDDYRYAWDARVQAAGVDPYAHPPDSPALAAYREPWLWPAPAACEELHRPPGCTRVNRASSPTIYPPAAELWFQAVYRVGGGVAAEHKPWQVAGVLTELGVLALLPLALRRHGRDARWAALYALSPAAAFEVVNNAHVDGLAVLLVVAALVVAGGPGRHRDLGAGALIGLAALVKVFPVLLVLALVGIAGASRAHRLLRAGAAAAGVVVAGYLPHVVTVGWRVLGYGPGYLREERYADGVRFLLAGLLGLTGPAAGAASAAGVAAVGAWVLWRRPEVPVGSAAIVGALLLATSPVQPWYGVLLLAVATVAAQPRWAAVAVASYPLYFAVILDAVNPALVGRLCYVVALAVVAAAALTRRPPPTRDASRPGSAVTRAGP